MNNTKLIFHNSLLSIQIHAQVGDVTKIEDIKSFVSESVNKFGKINSLVSRWNTFMHNPIYFWNHYVLCTYLFICLFIYLFHLFIHLHIYSFKINVVGAKRIKVLQNMSHEDLDHCLNGNIKSTLFMTQECLPHLKETKGKCIYFWS